MTRGAPRISLFKKADVRDASKILLRSQDLLNWNEFSYPGLSVHAKILRKIAFKMAEEIIWQDNERSWNSNASKPLQPCICESADIWASMKWGNAPPKKVVGTKQPKFHTALEQTHFPIILCNAFPQLFLRQRSCNSWIHLQAFS